MKNFGRTRKKIKFPLRAAALILLAAVCIGGVELFVCFYKDPALYDRLTAPVRAGVQRAAEAGQTAWNSLGQAVTALGQSAIDAADSAAAHVRDFWDSLTPEPEPEPDVQLVDNEPVAPPPRARADYSITALESRESGLDCLTGGVYEVIYFDQTSERWADASYGTDPLGSYGCGPTAMAMAVSTLTGEVTDPAQMAQYCVDHGYWARRQGSYWSIVPGVAEDFGLTCTSLLPEEADEDVVFHYLATGSLIVALMGPGHFTNGGHFIVLRGLTLDGSILVADPASQERSLTTWDLDLLLEELSPGRHNGGPLWVISPSLTP